MIEQGVPISPPAGGNATRHNLVEALRRTETGLMAARVQDSDALIVVASRGVAAGEVLRALSTMG